MQISIKTNFPDVQRRLDQLQKQTKFALAVALTRTAQDVRDDVRKEMRRAFDRPTAFTLNSLYLTRATKNKLEAQVFFKDGFSSKPHYLMPQIEGGSRPIKRFEELLKQRGVLRGNERAVPGQGARLDSHGNMSRGQIVQILSQLGAFNLAGASQNATSSKRSRAKRAKVSYFYSRQSEARIGLGSWKFGDKTQHLPTGIYAKTGRLSIKPVLVFVKGTKYRARLRFYAVAKSTVARVFPGHFDREFATAVRTAKLA